MDIEILNKPPKNINEDIKLKSSSEVIEIKDVRAIRNAYKEHLLFIGLDNGNNVRNISLLGVGSNCNVLINTKDILRTALLSCSDKVILVHNHPSNNLEPSSADRHITNVTNQILNTFNIELLDHIIVTEKDYISMEQIKRIDRNYTDDSLNKMSNGFLLEENQRLKEQIELLTQNNYKSEDLESKEDVYSYDY